MNVIVVDDEPKAIKIITRYIDKVPFLEKVGSFTDALEALEFLNCKKVDLLFLDINMPGLNGLELLKTLEKKPLVILTTAYHEYALESYEYNVTDYLLKPITFKRFLKAVNRANEAYSLLQKKYSNKQIIKSDDTVIIKMGHEFLVLPIEHIIYLQKDGNYLEVHTSKTQKHLLRLNMSEAFEYFPKQQFIRIHKSFIVNKSYIRTISASNVLVAEKNIEIPVGLQYRENLMKTFDIRK